MPAKIVPISTESGTHYAVVVNGETVCDHPRMTDAILWAFRHNLEVQDDLS